LVVIGVNRRSSAVARRCRPWRPAAGCLLVAAAFCAPPAGAASAGPIRVSARGVEFRSHDEDTGALRAHLVARSASMTGGAATHDVEATLRGARLVRYDASGSAVLEVRAEEGSYAGDRGARFSGGVEVEWHLERAEHGGTARFRCDDIAWDETKDTFTTDSAVRGRVLQGGARRPTEVEAAAGSGVVGLDGRGFTFVTAEARGEIVRDAVVRMDAPGGPGWRGTADGGVVFDGAGGVLVLRMRGPVATASGGSCTRSDELELRFGPAEGGELELQSGVLKGTVRALVDRRGTGGALLPGSLVPRLPGDRAGGAREAGPERGKDDRTELRAEVIEVRPASGEVVLHGTLTDPARVIFEGGELRGTRIDFTRSRVATDGGAPSEFVW
jgi:hypothetical protein